VWCLFDTPKYIITNKNFRLRHGTLPFTIPDDGDKDEYGPLARLLSFKTPDGLPWVRQCVCARGCVCVGGSYLRTLRPAIKLGARKKSSSENRQTGTQSHFHSPKSVSYFQSAKSQKLRIIHIYFIHNEIWPKVCDLRGPDNRNYTAKVWDWLESTKNQRKWLWHSFLIGKWIDLSVVDLFLPKMVL